ncbi:MAG TPA: serine/threonine-protein kinase [Baekduia sp.]|nr:serine/threonine-protein kinase [Baekduia sp.]
METAEHPSSGQADPGAPTGSASAWTAAGGGGEEVVLDRYRLEHRIGGGGFGVVWCAHDLKLDRSVAVKRIPVADADTARRAQREGVAAARLQHPAIVALHEAGADDAAVYLVSELVHGETFARLLEEGALSDRDVVRVGIALCDALAHAHKRGIVHRDVKPLNILVPDSQDGGPPAKLTDFGVARIAGDDALTRTGDVVGTLAYMAPEQAEGRDVGPAADLYALGLCLYEGLAGVNPVRARGAGATARRVGQRLPPLGRLRRDLPLDLCGAIDAAVWPHADERGTIAELRRALRAALDDVDDEPGTVAGGPLEPIAPVVPPERTGLVVRGLSAALAAGLTGAALALAAPDPPVAPLSGALAAAVASLLLPRLAWLTAAALIVGWLAGVAPDRAWLVAAAVTPVIPLLRWAPAPAWSAPAGGPLLALAGAAGAFPAVAGTGARAAHRAALGALGAWWTLLAEALLARRLVLGDGIAAAQHHHGAGAVVDVATAPGIALVGVWAVAAALMPLLVRGRSLTVDVVGATAWAAGLAAGTQAALGANPRGLVAASVLAGAAAVAVRGAWRRPETP